MPIHPCQGCVYLKECGNTNRTEPCKGRTTKSERKALYGKDKKYRSHEIKANLRNL